MLRVLLVAAPSIGARRRPTVLIVGAASRDVDSTDPRGWRLGGGVSYGAVALARLGVRTRALIGVDDRAASARELEYLRREGIDVRLHRLSAGPVFDNRRLPGGGRVQHAHGVAEAIPAEELPREWASSDAAVLSPVAGELEDDWAEGLPGEMIVALGWQGLLRLLRPGERVTALPISPRPLIGRADLNVVSAEDAVAGGRPLAELLSRPGQQLVVTNGPRSAVWFSREREGFSVRLLPVRPASQPIDETGAGDVLLAAWVAGVAAARLGGQRKAKVSRGAELSVAVTAASLHVENEGIDGVPDLGAICRRLLTRPG
ncbi:MAG TPA: PfkB family carbohydrate kinase [Candidatus Limnocylindrales bacterium]|nr:PfkB family carbohydrate kinase [Candidatus Limnocylindrales bacterium]